MISGLVVHLRESKETLAEPTEQLIKFNIVMRLIASNDVGNTVELIDLSESA